jgi:NAD(P)-dependent dehydrogenase (short-subunit alcohol dehydrogenase family)
MTNDDTVVVIGGSSGMGLAVARRCLADGAKVVIAGRSAARLEAASEQLARLLPASAGGSNDRLAAIVADIGDRAQLSRLFEETGKLSHLVVTAADLPYGPVGTLTEDDMMRAVKSKVTGPLQAAQLAAQRISGPGSITFTSGIAAYRPIPGGTLGAIVNGAIGSMVRALALELAPVRVNAVSPGWVDTPIWERVADQDAKRARFADMAARLPARRLGQAEDIANAICFLVNDSFVTGTVLHAEGAQLLV